MRYKCVISVLYVCLPKMSGHLHCIAYREHYQLPYSLLHPAKVDELCFLEEICRLLPIIEDDQLVEHLFGTGPWSLFTRGNLFIKNDK